MTEAQEKLEALLAGRRALVVGVGNSLCGDDGIGPFVAERVAGHHPARALDAGPVPENYLGAIRERAPQIVLFVDAAQHGGPAGSWCLAPMRDVELRVSSTHDASLRLVASLLEGEGSRCWLLGVQPAALEAGTTLSAALRASGEQLAESLARALGREVAHA